MANQIIRQPSGMYSVWSTVVDDFIRMNMTREKLVKFLVDREEERILSEVNRICDQLDKGEEPYFQFTKSWEEALRIRHSVHGRLKE